MFTDQSSFAVRLEWGERGLDALGAPAGATPDTADGTFILVDVLSFSTSVDVATARGAAILPYPRRDDTAARFAAERNAQLASAHRAHEEYSLAPSSLTAIGPGTRLVLPSPNGATLSLRAAEFGTTIAGSLRNASAVARFVQRRGGPIAVIACGERWPDGSLRPCWEDLIGAGAILAQLATLSSGSGTLSPEAQAAVAAFRASEAELAVQLAACSSGRELIERGFAEDVRLAAEYDMSEAVPVLRGGAFMA